MVSPGLSRKPRQAQALPSTSCTSVVAMTAMGAILPKAIVGLGGHDAGWQLLE